MLQITATEPPTAHRWRREGRLIRPWGTALRGHGRQTPAGSSSGKADGISISSRAKGAKRAARPGSARADV